MAGSSNAAADAASPEELLEYNKALNANVSNFVTVKLSGHENYDIWHAQMMCLVDVYNMRCLFNYDHAWHSSKSGKIVERYDNLLKGWVSSSIHQEVLKRVSHHSSGMLICNELENLYASDRIDLVGSSIVSAVAASPDELEYNRAFNANVSNFVTVKLSGYENYDIWHAQMMCLIEVCNMSGLFNYDHAWYSSKSREIVDRYDNLLKGWVISSIDQEVLKRVSHHSSGMLICNELENLYDRTDLFDSTTPDKSIKDALPNDEESTELMMKLFNATMGGRWWKAKAILKNHENAATIVINNNGDTMLHLAVKEGKNYFLNQLLNFIKDGSEIKMMNRDGHTALHTAVLVDNKQAAELLVNKSNKLLYVSSDRGVGIPLVLAYTGGKINTFLYLFEATRDGLEQLHSIGYLGVHHLFANATSTKQYNLALKLVKTPELLKLAAKDDKALMALTTDFPRELSFQEALIYPSMFLSNSISDFDY